MRYTWPTHQQQWPQERWQENPIPQRTQFPGSHSPSGFGHHPSFPTFSEVGPLQEESSYLSYDRSQLMPGVKFQGKEKEMRNERTRYGSTFEDRAAFNKNSNQNGYLQSLLGLVTGKEKLQIEGIKKASPIGHINLVPREEADSTFTTKPDNHNNIHREETLLKSRPIPTIVHENPADTETFSHKARTHSGNKQNMIQPVFVNQAKENTRETRASFQKPLEFLRLNPSHRSQLKKKDSLFQNQESAASVRKLIDLIDNDKSLRFPKIISFNSGSKRYKYVYLSSTPNAATLNSKEIVTDKDLSNPIGNFVRGSYSIPTREDAIVRLNHARSLRRQKQNELDKNTNNEEIENAPPISISLLEKAIIVSKRNRQKSLSEEPVKSVNEKSFALISASPEFREDVSSSMINEPTIDHLKKQSFTESPSSQEDALQLRDYSNESSSAAPSLETSTYFETNLSKSLGEQLTKIEFQTPSRDFDDISSTTLHTNAWIPSTHIFGQPLSSTTTEFSASKKPTLSPYRIIEEKIGDYTFLKAVKRENVVAEPPKPEFWSPTENPVTDAYETSSKRPQVPLSIHNLLKIVNEFHQSSEDTRESPLQSNLNDKDILKKSLDISEDSPNSHNRFNKKNNAVIGSMVFDEDQYQDSKEIFNPYTGEKLPRYPTKEMIHDPVMLERRRIAALQKFNQVHSKTKVNVKPPISTPETTTEKQKVVMSIADQIDWFEKTSQKSDEKSLEVGFGDIASSESGFDFKRTLQEDVPTNSSDKKKFSKVSGNDLKQLSTHDSNSEEIYSSGSARQRGSPKRKRLQARMGSLDSTERPTSMEKLYSTPRTPTSTVKVGTSRSPSGSSKSLSARQDAGAPKSSNFEFGKTMFRRPSELSEIFTKVARAATAQVFAAAAKASSS